MASVVKLIDILTNIPTDEVANRSQEILQANCGTPFDRQSYYLSLMVPAILLTVLLAFTQKRKSYKVHLFNGRPGLVYPMNFLGRSKRFIYGSAFGAISFHCFEMVLHNRYVIDYHGPAALKIFILLFSVLVYGIDYYPLFASLAVDSFIGYIIGSLYSIVLATVFFVTTFTCVGGYSASTVFRIIGNLLPILLCLLFTTFGFPVRMGLFIREKLLKTSGKYKERTQLEKIQRSYHGLHVRHILKEKENFISEKEYISWWRKRYDDIVDMLYRPIPNFKFSTRMVSVMMIGLIGLYTLFMELMLFSVPILNKYIDVLHYLGSAGKNTLANLLARILYISKVCCIVSGVIPFVLGVLNILHCLTSSRSDLLDLYKGEYGTIPRPTKKQFQNMSLLAASVRFGGYQVGYILWAYVVQLVLLLLTTFILAVFIEYIELRRLLLQALLQLLPLVLSAGVIIILQLVLSRYVFLQNNARDLVIDNRRGFFIFVYFMFFFNMFLGVASCILRVFKALIIGLLFLSRLDRSNLPQRFQSLDPGFRSYIGFMCVESYHTNPILITFTKLLRASLLRGVPAQSQISKDQRTSTLKYLVKNVFDYEEMVEGSDIDASTKRSKISCLRWHLFYTLPNNPQLKALRKHSLAHKNPTV